MRINQTTLLCLLGLLLSLLPSHVQAHTDSIAMSGWANGFNHPLHGWDHLLTMLAVGVWAAQLGGRAVWQLPIAFVGVMSLGGLAGMMGVSVPGVETMILLSVLVFGFLIVCRIRFQALLSVLIVVFFAFFHGYAHGQEMPTSASLLSFALGFMLATLLLHGAGIVAARLVLLAFAYSLGNSAYAEPSGNAAPGKPNAQVTGGESVELSEMIVTERADSMIGYADSASQGNVGQEQLEYRPITRPGEILETVPGLIASQHSGEGKANQYYLRGFNLDHGTDFLTQIEGVPVNQVSNAHGQGWTDTNFLIPELIRTLNYQKGNYYAENGDFSSTGAANIKYFNDLRDNIAKFTGGSFDYYRGLAAGSSKLDEHSRLLYAGEVVNNGGPWTVSNDYLKFNGVLRYSKEHADSGWSVTAMAYKADWNSTDQIPKRAVEAGLIDRNGTIDPTDGGSSQRYSLTAEWHRQNDSSATHLMVYGLYTQMDLYSNFTYFLNDPVRGDQFAQPDQRWTSGLKASHTFFHHLGAVDSETTLGLQIRNDTIENGLLLTQAQVSYDTVRADEVWVTSVSPYAENKTHWNDWLRTTLGVRFDGFRFNVDNSNIQENNGNTTDGLVSPKLGIVFGPWADTELYLNGGLGFHSNDARGVNTRVDPASGKSVDADGNPVKPAAPLARTYGAETGLRTTWVKGLHSTLALWWLDIDSELLFVGDAGTTEASRPSRRYGVEWANYYSPTDWLNFDADFSFSKSRFRDDAPEGNHIPGSVETVIASGATFHDLYGGFFGGPRLRYFGPRSLIEDNSVRSDSTILLSAMLGYAFNKNWTVQAEMFNLLDRKDSAIDYYYPSRLPGEDAAGIDDVHFHPIEPMSFRISLKAAF
ncbi:TonB-dependent receptor [Methylicorpusculum oleiharenae]|uniref:TonB-dependent receptor domain-containing protein n=1 Tax=Methylicorpusculum oleiharenae TaxID=1338687 RepID=UPI0013573C05|nr:TonB-dependent receptor [Methylicorpusculum oleiharenae]MCD2448827.1 TonB-dependent receptor [Methylicorpusculum oleiharenae]